MSEAETAAEPEVLACREGRVLRLVLNRPRQINALTLNMVRLLAEALSEAESDDAARRSPSKM